MIHSYLLFIANSAYRKVRLTRMIVNRSTTRRDSQILSGGKLGLVGLHKSSQFHETEEFTRQIHHFP